MIIYLFLSGRKPSLSWRAVKLDGWTEATNQHHINRNPNNDTFEIAGNEFAYKHLKYVLYTEVTVNGTDKLYLTVQTSMFT